MRPYIGITDFTDFSQVEKLLDVLRSHNGNVRHMLHVGIMSSYKTLYGIPTKWQDIFVPKNKIARIFASTEAYNCIHFADYDNNPNLGRSLLEMTSWGGMNLHAVQLDMIWPDPEEIALFINNFPKEIEVILQIGKNALEIVNNNSDEVVEKMKTYRGLVKRVLLDKSMGQGVGMDAVGLIPFAKAIQKNFPEIGLGVAGGLGPNSVKLVEPLAEIFPDISIDAQGKLRPSGSAMDPIDWEMAKIYLSKSLEMFSRL